VTLRDALDLYESIKKRIRSAMIGIGANKPGVYTDPRHHSYGKQRKRRAVWALELAKSKEELRQFLKDAESKDVVSKD
jgi:hypothetical protein